MIHLKRLYAHNFKQLQEIDLYFPERARVLVQGKNEAGKSTLFEAVYFALFGMALATESGARNLDDLIRYEVEKAVVELDLQFGNRLFKIKRTIARGKTNTWELDVERDGDLIEEIRGNTVVNKRLVAELGFDGDALLNTCFVEQKKLEKLEGLSKSKREESLAKLLNLDRLVQIENDLKVGAEDKRELERLKKRSELAAIQAELPALEKQLAQAEEKLKLIDLRAAVDGATVELRALEKLDAEIQTFATQRDQAAQRVERLDAVKQAMIDVKQARDALERANDQTREMDRLKQAQADVRRSAEQIPELQKRIAQLTHAASQMQRLARVNETGMRQAQRAQQIAKAQTRAAELNASIARDQDALAQTETQIKQSAVDEALSEWILAKRDTATTTAPQEIVAAKKIERDQLVQKFRRAVFAWGGLALGLGAFAVIAPIVAVVLGNVALPLIVIPGLIFVVLAAVAVIVMIYRATRTWLTLSRVSEELGQAEGEARANSAAIAAQAERLTQVEAQLAKLDQAIPASVFDAQARRSTQTKSIDELRGEQDAIRDRLAQARAVLDETARQNGLSDAASAQAERAQCERRAQKAEHILETWHARMQNSAQALGVTVTPSSIQQALYQIQSQIDQVQRRVSETARMDQDIAQREKQMQALIAQARENYESARTRADKPTRAVWNDALTLDDYTAFGKELRADYDAIGGDAAIKQLREVEGGLGRKQGERATRRKNADVLLDRIRALVPSFPSFPSDSATREIKEITELGEKLRGLVLGDEATWRAQQRELVGRVRSLSDRQTQLERDLGLTDMVLDRAECQAQWERKMRETQVRERGVEIAAFARRRIAQKILPATMDYMRQILPTLTRDRYHDAQLDPETYKIQVWDERAGASSGAFKEKNIFSGGTKDQFSLALRLAFALATMPQERGASPSFIFLDEPLGAFDDERADALIYLLTEGEIARAFDQIFLISHVHVNEQLFTHRLILENGRVAETDLPKE